MSLSELKDLTNRLSLDLHVTREQVGNTTLALTTLRDLNDTIDQMFDELQRIGKPELLDRLCPYFGVIWPAARALAEVVDHELIAGLQKTIDTKVLELGCGLALPSIIASLKGAQVLATDYHPQVERFLSINQTECKAQSLRYQEWDWRNSEEIPVEIRKSWGKIDWVFASDVLYDRDLPIPLAQAMSQAIHPKGRITLTDQGRPYLQLFCDTLIQEHGFKMSMRVVRVKNPSLKGNSHQEIFVLDFRR